MPFLPAVCLTISALMRVVAADTSPHTQRIVSIMPGVSLEVLDWGGHGPPVVLLTGIGNTAHVYDDLAPRLARDFRVYGITRRGYGRSSGALPGLTIDRLAEDVAAVLDSLHLDRPALIGHSLGSMELVVLGTRYGARLRGLVFSTGPTTTDTPTSSPPWLPSTRCRVHPPALRAIGPRTRRCRRPTCGGTGT